MNPNLILGPVLEHGLLGIVAGLLLILVWVFRRLLDALADTSAVIAENTAAIRSLDTRSAELFQLTSDMRDRLLTSSLVRDIE